MLIAHTPPWHLWGGSQVVRTVTQGIGLAPVEASQQLCKINYGRPETWNFLFAAKIVGNSAMNPGDAGLLNVRFDLTVGIGRSSTTLLGQGIGFENYQFSWVAPPSEVPKALIYSTSVHAPNRTTDPAPALQRENLVTQFVAHDIQCSALITNLSAYAGFVDVEVSAYFAPNTHVRPDWLLVDAERAEQFPGGEIGAR